LHACLKEPPLIACAIGKKACLSESVESTKEFTVNVSTEELEVRVYYCGYHSGHAVDRFEGTGSAPVPARNVRAPIIVESVAHMECRVVQEFETGDKYPSIGQVIEAYADEMAAKGENRIECATGEYPSEVYGVRSKKL
jgi:flavin reductase (DIM6/NTAB) family NADH-FMN oxidoreductase RutF